MSKSEKPIVCEIVAGVVSLYLWPQVVLYMSRINVFKGMFYDMGGELPAVTHLVLNHFAVAIPLIISIVLFALSFLPTTRSNQFKRGFTVALSLGISLVNLTICGYGSYAPMFDMVNMVG